MISQWTMKKPFAAKAGEKRARELRAKGLEHKQQTTTYLVFVALNLFAELCLERFIARQKGLTDFCKVPVSTRISTM